MNLESTQPDSSKTTTLTNLRCVTPDSKWLKLWAIDWKRGDVGGTWTFASRKKAPEAGNPSQVTPDAVIIVANKNHRLVVTKEYRVPIGGYEYGLPAGLIDKGETAEQAAAREIWEETGYKPENIYYVSPPVYSSAGMTDESTVYVFMTVSGEPTNQHKEAAEDIEVLELSDQDLVHLCERYGQFENVKIGAKLWPILYAEACRIKDKWAEVITSDGMTVKELRTRFDALMKRKNEKHD